MKKADSHDPKNKISLKKRPGAREDIFVDKGQDPHVPKNLYVTPKKKRLPPWLIPLSIIVLLLLAVFVLLPALLSDVDVNEPIATEPPTVTEPEIPHAGQGDRAVLKRTSAFLFEEPDKASPHICELLLNEELVIRDTSRRDWLGVELADGISGYVERDALTADTSSLQEENAVMKVIIRDPFKRVMSHARGGTLLIEAPMGTVLYADYHNSGLVRVRLPEGEQGWMNTQGVFLLEVDQDLPLSEDFAQSFISTAIAFENSPHVPGGQTRRGVSTAGIVRLSAFLNGLELPRTVDQLMNVGTAVNLPQTSAQPAIIYLRPGDLVFFHKKSDAGSLDRMALCLNEDRLLLSLHNKSSMQLIDFDSREALELSERIMEVRRLAPGNE